ncbi:MAG: DNA phosphorothioation-associated putative methyltransferase [Lamprobacter sp.]|uniref:DNA phosphorothioation-associated putative methyltransferase n=1 Tax=Lamprobacter sp. TaxID=3100796 RepID=UPI002B257AAA|nr:DNA phosphorothioation-associated putative methyltransferase [Lamprobacter sp.]MEA3638917.1 DNA phosphorothioation-associated putative methyltransferase [Lamprobacter sp.]
MALAHRGKTIGRRTYLHIDALTTVQASAGSDWQALVVAAEQAVGVERGVGFNVVRLDAESGEVALLHYPAFFDDPFPALRESWRFEPATGAVGYRTYADSLNPPILHRKELLLPADHPRLEEYQALTEAAELIGLFEDTTRIGYRRQWLELVRAKGYRFDGHLLVPLGNVEDDGDGAGDREGDGQQDREGDRARQALAAGEAASHGAELEGSLYGLPEGGPAPGAGSGADGARPSPAGWEAARHRTAMVRYGFSAPIQSLARHGFLDGQYRLFDYGCGRGDDLRGLRENGLTASGWDPYFAPEQPIQSADLVNLGFVINVIEDFDERLEALQRAWSLAERLLVVSVMLANQNDPRGTCFRDGVITQRQTFQKYFTQQEIKAFLTDALDEEPIPVAPGVLYVFRDKDAEQRFLVERYRRRRSRLRDPSAPASASVRSARAPRISQRRDRRLEQYAAHQALLERLWEQWLSLGRRPEKADLDAPELLALSEGFGSLSKALLFLERYQRETLGEEAITALLECAEAERMADLEVYLALQQFERRRPYTHLEAGLQRDIKAFFGDYAAARTAGFASLLRIADVEAITAACREAWEHGLGWLELAEAEAGAERTLYGSLTLHSSLVEQLPALLRVYINAAAVLYGDLHNADLLKIHIGSGKLTLMRFDDFDGRALPRMLERVKIKLREQDVDLFGYGEVFEPPYLYRKSRFINEEHPGYPEQVAFDEALDQLEARGLLDLSGYGPAAAELDARLARHRWEVDGLRLRRLQTAPALDDSCGQFLRFRDLIECGETYQRLAAEGAGIDNLPQQPESYNALLELAEQVLDPVIDWFGMIQLTYGFCSPPLVRQIPGRIDPKRDQHAAHERNRLGNLICPRLGAAVDFIIADEDMHEVAQWVADNTPFDRLYFYGADKPIHVSYGPEQSRQLVSMLPGPSGRLVPRTLSLEAFPTLRSALADRI